MLAALLLLDASVAFPFSLWGGDHQNKLEPSAGKKSCGPGTWHNHTTGMCQPDMHVMCGAGTVKAGHGAEKKCVAHLSACGAGTMMKDGKCVLDASVLDQAIVAKSVCGEGTKISDGKCVPVPVEKHVSAQAAAIDCLPPSSSPSIPPPSPSQLSCWVSGDPHVIPFVHEDQHEAYGLGIRTMASWGTKPGVAEACATQRASKFRSLTATEAPAVGADNYVCSPGVPGVVQYYSCPVACTGSLNSTWHPCGASSAVAVAAEIDGKAIAVTDNEVYVDGIQVVSIHGFGAWESEDGKMVISRGLDNDQEMYTPGEKTMFTIKTTEGSFELATWTFKAAKMPTGYVHNTRLSMPDAMTWTHYNLDGSCFDDKDRTLDEAPAEPIKAWPAGLLVSLKEKCESYTGIYTPAATHEELCRSSGVSLVKAQQECQAYLMPKRYRGCVVDYCATANANMVPRLNLPVKAKRAASPAAKVERPADEPAPTLPSDAAADIPSSLTKPSPAVAMQQQFLNSVLHFTGDDCSVGWSEETAQCYLAHNADVRNAVCPAFPTCNSTELKAAQCHYSKFGSQQMRDYACTKEERVEIAKHAATKRAEEKAAEEAVAEAAAAAEAAALSQAERNRKVAREAAMKEEAAAVEVAEREAANARAEEAAAKAAKAAAERTAIGMPEQHVQFFVGDDCGTGWDDETTVCYLERNVDVAKAVCASYPACNSTELLAAQCHYGRYGKQEKREYNDCGGRVQQE